MITIIEFDEQYLDSFEYNGVEKEMLENSGVDIKALIKGYAKNGECWMGLADNKVIGIGGIYPLWEGVAQAWVFLNKEIKQYLRDILNALKTHLEKAIQKYRRIQIVCLQASPEANNLAKHLGFKKEGVLEQYTPDKRNMVMYAILKEGE